MSLAILPTDDKFGGAQSLAVLDGMAQDVTRDRTRNTTSRYTVTHLGTRADPG